MRGLGLDQAAQAEADVPALVALDALDPLTHARQGAVGQIVEQRVLPGVEDDPLEQHVVEADALARARCGPPRARRPSPAAAPRRARGRRAGRGRGPRRAARPAWSPGSPRTSAAMRSNSRAWRCSSRRWRKKTQAIRLSCDANVASLAASANGVRCSATASSATQKPARSVIRRPRRSAGSSCHSRASGRGRWPPDPTAGGRRGGRRSSARSCGSRTSPCPPTTLCSRSLGSARMATLMSRRCSSAIASR